MLANPDGGAALYRALFNRLSRRSAFFDSSACGKSLVAFGAIARPILSSAALGVVEKRHESEIHMQLLVTMEQSQTGIVSYKVHFHFLVTT